jgi:predicted nucleic acid-binding protein
MSLNKLLYLDNCCFNRPYDDKSYLTIRLESEAKLFVQKEILQGTFDLVWSYMIDYENAANPYAERREAILRWKDIAKSDVDFSEEINETGRRLMKLGLKNKDALHVACALRGRCDYFLTTDRGILNKKIVGIAVMNPLDFVRELGA